MRDIGYRPGLTSRCHYTTIPHCMYFGRMRLERRDRIDSRYVRRKSNAPSVLLPGSMLCRIAKRRCRRQNMFSRRDKVRYRSYFDCKDSLDLMVWKVPARNSRVYWIRRRTCMCPCRRTCCGYSWCHSRLVAAEDWLHCKSRHIEPCRNKWYFRRLEEMGRKLLVCQRKH